MKLRQYLLIAALTSIFHYSQATLYIVGSGTTQTTSTTQTPFSNAVSDARRQYIIRATELTSQGALYGNITSLAFKVGTTFNTNTLSSYTVKMKQTSLTVLSGTFDDVGFTTVYSNNVSVTDTGWKTLAFTTNLFWDGSSNLLVAGNPPGFNIYTGAMANIYKGAVNPLTVHAFGDAQNVHDLIVYIDYNHDGVFSASELIASGGPDDSTPALNLAFTIPPTALDGMTKMRVRCVRVGWESPCGTVGTSQSQTGDYFVNIHQAPSPGLKLTVFVEGMYNNGALTPLLYNAGLTSDSTASDSVIVNLRGAVSPFAVLYSAAGVVHTDGNVSVSFPVSCFDQQYYIGVRHRNSIETISKTPVRLYPAVKEFQFDE